MTSPSTKTYLFFSHKTKRFHDSVGQYSNKSQKKSKRSKNIIYSVSFTWCAAYYFVPQFNVICDLLLEKTHILHTFF